MLQLGWDEYGRTAKNGKARYAHCVAYEEFIGPIPKGLQINHHCDIRPCCNPYHLYAGTSKQNVQDMIKRGRQIIAKHPNPLKGEEQPNSKLKADSVRALLNEYHTMHFTKRQLAEKYKVSKHTIQAIVSRKMWKHIHEELDRL